MSTKRLWHATQSSSSKWYSYRFTLGPTLLNPLERFVRTHIVHRPSFAPTSSCGQPYALTTDDITRLKSILEVYVGTHDFKAFGGQLEQNEKRSGKKMNTIRTIHTVELVKESFFYSTGSSELNYRIDFLIEGALYKMVRNMVGTAIQVWLGNMKQTQLVELLQIDESGDAEKSRKDNPCKPAPPEGLTLECVYYDDLF
jgi:tRNA pseudouridine38-40 synthase